MDELISVIINVYNEERFIKKCLDSVINQTYKNLEILIINDGSTDNTLSICESYTDERIRIINQDNMGLSLARNVGIENANGEYLYFIDSDDFVDSDVIEYLYNLSKKHNVKMSTCRPMYIYNYDFKIKSIKEKEDIISSKDMIKKIILSERGAGMLWNKLIQKDVFEEIRFEDRIINDAAIMYKICIKCGKIVYSNQYKYYYFRHSDSITGKNSDDRSVDLCKAVIERYYYLKDVFPDFIENDIGLILIIIHIYCSSGEKTLSYLKDNNVIKQIKGLVCFKIFLGKVRIKEKIKIILFFINPKLCRKIRVKYQKIRYGI